MPLTELQRDTVETITTILETGRLPGPEAYGTVTILADGAGLSYGARQATAGSSSLTGVLQAFERRGGQLQRGDYALVGASVGYDCLVLDERAKARGCRKPAPPPIVELSQRLKAWGSDPRMQAAQEEIFRERYAEPAERYTERLGLVLPLSYCVIHDTWIQSNPQVIADLRQRFPEYPPSLGGEEKRWTTAFLKARHQWLSNHPRAAVRTSAYRTKALLELVAEDRWLLERPLTIRGLTIR